MAAINPSAIFESVRNKQGIGIGTEMLTDEVLSKTGAQLIGNDAIIHELLSYRGAGSMHNILYRQLGEYGWAEWVTCLSFEFLLDYTLPMISKVLHINICVPGFYYKGEIICRILKHDSSVWVNHPEWKPYFVTLLNAAFLQYNENELQVMLDERMYKELKKIYSSNQCFSLLPYLNSNAKI